MTTEPLTPMSLEEWFDPYDQGHIAAYRALQRDGTWPEGFIPDTVTVRNDGIWNIQLVELMAQAWLHAMENGHIKAWVRHE